MLYLKEPERFTPQIEAVGCFVEVQGRILLLLRVNSARIEPGKWGFPGGKAEKAENPISAMLRELKEETGLTMAPRHCEEAGMVFVDYKEYGQKFTYSMFRLVLPFFPEIKLNPQEHQAYVWILPSAASSLELMEDAFECLQLVYGH